jgi:ribosomal protein RSM22 (predicted rRNA methylase)
MKQPPRIQTNISVVLGPRPDTDIQWPRVVRPVLVRSGHTICRLCTQEGKLEEIIITRAKYSK